MRSIDYRTGNEPDERGNAERRALIVELWPPML
jgi:hypothetical protein